VFVAVGELVGDEPAAGGTAVFVAVGVFVGVFDVLPEVVLLGSGALVGLFVAVGVLVEVLVAVFVEVEVL
jgi:hypothetical protein